MMATRQPLARRCVLVAEDDPASRALLNMQLEVLGLPADISADGAEALRKWQAGGHVLILADRNMPGMNGLALARAVRAAERMHVARVPIIAITAEHSPIEFRRCIDAGMDDILPKPIELNDLRRVLARWLPQMDAGDAVARQDAGNAEAILDVSVPLRLAGADAWQTRVLVGLFTADARATLDACRQDMRLLAPALHRLKAAARSVGALHFAALAESVENAVRAERHEGVETGGVEALARALAATEQAALHIGDVLPSTASSNVLSRDAMLEGLRCDAFTARFLLQEDAVRALPYWQREGRPVSPESIIAAARHHGLGATLYAVVLTKALLGIARLLEAGFSPVMVMHVPGCWLAAPEMSGFVMASLLATGVQATLLRLEVDDIPPAALENADRLHDAGIALAVTDAGDVLEPPLAIDALIVRLRAGGAG